VGDGISRSYLILYVTIVTIGLLLTAGIVYYAGPGHLQSDHYEEGIADILLSGNNVGNPGDYNAGIVQKYYVSKLRDKKEVVVIGSSRSMQLRNSLFPGRSFFNNSGPWAHLGDLFAIYGLYEEKGLMPSVVILGLDPWMLDKSQVELGWKCLEPQYHTMAQRLGIESSVGNAGTVGTMSSTIRELLSWPNFENALFNLLLNVSYFPTEGRPDVPLLLSDGSISFRSEPSNIVEANARSWAKNPESRNGLTGFAHSTELDQERIKSLEAFVDYLHGENVEVIFWLAPYHPAAYDILRHSGQNLMLLKAESCFRDIAKDKDVPVVGSYDPQQSNSTRDDFYDAVHPKESSIEKAFSKLKCTESLQCSVAESPNP